MVSKVVAGSTSSGSEAFTFPRPNERALSRVKPMLRSLTSTA